MPLKSDRALVVFSLGEKLGALPLESVEKIAPMADLARPPGLPAPLEGILNLAGAAVPVVRLDRLLQLPERRLGLYSMLVLLKAERLEDRVAMLVDRVVEILNIPSSAMLPVGTGDSFNACIEGTVTMGGQVVHVLSPRRILLEREHESLSAFRTIEQRRLDDWKTVTP
ncbi:MAG TPA: chemotaxis protein CheW [Bryobacteraceae bacterium]|jgi:purine-binding chemotaxis protein CheW|nr:chemotaxis protein CheW [Bryobacteraceae bacterium]